MFEPKKAKEDTSPSMAPDSDPALHAFAGRFLPQELSILAVTGANSLAGGKEEGDALWTISMELTAWREEDGEIHQGDFLLTTLANDELLKYLHRHTRKDSVIRCRVRPDADGKDFLLLSIPKPGDDTELEAILKEQCKPVTFQAEGLGTFTLNRRVGWFEAEVDWLGEPVSLEIDKGADRERCLDHARAMLAAAADWDRRIREYGADALLEIANRWIELDQENGIDVELMTRESFMERMSPESLQIGEDGSFDFWLDDGEMAYNRTVHVSGDLEKGPAAAELED